MGVGGAQNRLGISASCCHPELSAASFTPNITPKTAKLEGGVHEGGVHGKDGVRCPPQDPQMGFSFGGRGDPKTDRR